MTVAAVSVPLAHVTQVRPVVIEVLERKIGRPVTYAEAGLQPPKGGEDSDSGDTVESLLDFDKVHRPSSRGTPEGQAKRDRRLRRQQFSRTDRKENGVVAALGHRTAVRGRALQSGE
ncbi:hypothetical protein [Streptomyces sp. NPDC056308]|uniref:hypothetical protein n=1 Tax=Streptomyces sp. NPDC056308 TaxID=3345780 RepID=UPI0035D9094A